MCVATAPLEHRHAIWPRLQFGGAGHRGAKTHLAEWVFKHAPPELGPPELGPRDGLGPREELPPPELGPPELRPPALDRSGFNSDRSGSVFCYHGIRSFDGFSACTNFTHRGAFFNIKIKAPTLATEADVGAQFGGARFGGCLNPAGPIRLRFSFPTTVKIIYGVLMGFSVVGPSWGSTWVAVGVLNLYGAPDGSPPSFIFPRIFACHDSFVG